MSIYKYIPAFVLFFILPAFAMETAGYSQPQTKIAQPIVFSNNSSGSNEKGDPSFKVTPQSLKAAYSGIIQNGNVTITRFSSKWCYTFEVTFYGIKDDAKEVDQAYANISINGANLTIIRMEVRPEFRGNGFVGQFLEKSIELLKKITSDPQSTISLEAATFLAIKGTYKYTNEFIGAYVWTTYGFDFLEDINTEDDLSVDSIKGFKQRFMAWLHHRYALSVEEEESILETINTFKHSWEFARHDFKDNLINKDALKDTIIGRIYLFDNLKNDPVTIQNELYPRWQGVLFIYKPETPGMKIFLNKIRNS